MNEPNTYPEDYTPKIVQIQESVADGVLYAIDELGRLFMAEFAHDEDDEVLIPTSIPVSWTPLPMPVIDGGDSLPLRVARLSHRVAELESTIASVLGDWFASENEAAPGDQARDLPRLAAVLHPRGPTEDRVI